MFSFSASKQQCMNTNTQQIMWMKLCQGLKSGLLLFGWGFGENEPNRETQKESLSTSTDRAESILFMLWASRQPHPGQKPQSSTVLCLAPERSGLLVQAQWCSITATWFLDGSWRKARQLAGWAEWIWTGCICLYRCARCFEKGGFCMLEQEPYEESMGCLFLVWVSFCCSFFGFFFPSLVSLLRRNTELKGKPPLKTKDP